MSIVFIPTIPSIFKRPKPKLKDYNFASGHVTEAKVKVLTRDQMPWTDVDLLLLIELRVLKCSFEECGKYLNRSANACTGAVQTNNLYEAINKKRKKLLEEVLA